MSKTNWKGFELKVARDLGTERVLMKGKSVSDVIKEIGDIRLVIDCKNRISLNVVESFEKLLKYKEKKGDILVLIYRKTNSRKIEVYMLTTDLVKLILGIGKEFVFSPFINFLVMIDYKDFLKLVRNYEKHSNRYNKKKD